MVVGDPKSVMAVGGPVDECPQSFRLLVIRTLIPILFSEADVCYGSG